MLFSCNCPHLFSYKCSTQSIVTHKVEFNLSVCVEDNGELVGVRSPPPTLYTTTALGNNYILAQMFVETKQSMLCGQSCSKHHRVLSHIGVTEKH